VVFEVQQNSDVTFRLYDWGRVDPKTSQPRPLQVPWPALTLRTVPVDRLHRLSRRRLRCGAKTLSV
jgi:mannose-6-phosphate isomerase class I